MVCNSTWSTQLLTTAHHPCLEGPVLQIHGNSLMRYNVSDNVHAHVYDMCMLCFAVALVFSIVTPIHTFYSRCDLELQVYTQVGVFCKVYCSVQLYLCTLWNGLFRFVCAISVLLLCVQYCLYLSLAHYHLHCMHMCLWAAFQKCMYCKLPIAQSVLAPMELK